jgi:hypothetical protein
MKRFTINGNQAAAASTSILGLTSAATIRPEIIGVRMGFPETPTDYAFKIQLNRHTAAGTSTAVTPHADDPITPAYLGTAGENHTAEPTFTAGAVLLNAAFNQKDQFVWDMPIGRGKILPATAANGATLRFISVSAGTPVCEAEMTFVE